MLTAGEYIEIVFEIWGFCVGGASVTGFALSC